MKLAKFDPTWALIFGFLVAPFVCAFNAVLLMVILNVYVARSRPNSVSVNELFQVGGIAEIFTMTLGFTTMQLLQFWNSGKHYQARTLGLIFGILAAFCWVCLSQTSDLNAFDRPQIVGALLLPFLWSLLIPLFAFFARPPKI